ncbi:MAG: FAD-dependent oxidoreductase, partial [Gemmatimonadetes bacterium]|nr:FAD-dependent oxidoreductase [Gemmatimonadota bacterium]
MTDESEARALSAPPPRSAEVVVVGAGLSGLSCALLLERQGVDVHLVEASDGVGGRVRTDLVEGFRLDRGFQVLLTAYEEVQRQVDLPRLSLQSFQPGSVVWTGRGLERLSDPFRDPAGALASLKARVGSLSDKLKVAKLRRDVLAQEPDMSFRGGDRTTLAELQGLGFSPGFIDGFFRPFLGGVFLERALETSSLL